MRDRIIKGHPDDRAHNDEIDRLDAIRFRRLVKAALDGDAWFMRMAGNVHSNPRNLHEARKMIDYVIRVENS